MSRKRKPFKKLLSNVVSNSKTAAEKGQRYGRKKRLDVDVDAKFLHADIRYHEFDYRKKLSFATSIFTLQFMPKRDREDVIKKVYDQLQPGGAFVFAEKVYCDNPQIQDMMTFMYYDHKKESFTCDDIMTKEKTLRHMLKPNTWDELKQFMYNAGFKDVQVFWRNFMFIGAIAIK